MKRIKTNASNAKSWRKYFNFECICDKYVRVRFIHNVDCICGMAWHGMAHIQPHMHKLCVLRGFHKNLKNQKYEKKSPQRNAMNFEHFMSCSICLWEFKRIYFHRIVHSSLFTNYHKLKYIPPDSRCICACVLLCIINRWMMHIENQFSIVRFSVGKSILNLYAIM